MLDGKTVGGIHTRARRNADARRGAAPLHLGSAWFAFDDDKRGSLEAGKLADLAVLTKDYLSVPVEEIGTSSLLTMVGGRVVYASGPTRRWRTRPRTDAPFANAASETNVARAGAGLRYVGRTPPLTPFQTPI